MKSSHLKVIVVGSGFSGLATASHLAKEGHEVTILEKNDTLGGRARAFQAEGFTFDMGPSWYWMPDIFETYFAAFGKKPSDYYSLKRLSPSYKVFFADGTSENIPADLQELRTLIGKIEPGSEKYFDKFLKEAEYKYDIGISKMVQKPGLSWAEFLDKDVIIGGLKMHVFKSFRSYINKYFKSEKVRQLLEFPILFLGAKPEDTPALYSLMNYADMALGTWYPEKGMHEIIKGMVSLAKDLGVKFETGQDVKSLEISGKTIKAVKTSDKEWKADLIVCAGDYQHFDQKVVPQSHQSYNHRYWESRKMAPSSLLYYLGLDTKIPDVLHHNLFFDRSFDAHAKEIYDNPKWPEDPLFYACCPSKTDESVAPDGQENLFLLIPSAPGLEDTEKVKEHYLNVLSERILEKTGLDIRKHIVYKRAYAYSDFRKDYYAFKGNAYGLANTLSQTAVLKPRIKSKKIDNLYYTGQLTVPGPGVPPSLISGEVVARHISQNLHQWKK